MGKVAGKREKTTAFGVVIFSIMYSISLLCYGGFYETSIVLAGIFALVVICLQKTSIRISLSQGFFLLFSLWYFFCSLQNGFFLEPLVRGLLPLIVFLFWVILSSAPGSREKIVDILLEVSLWVAVIAVLHCVVKSIEASSVQRLTFPFDYSNVCGLYFAVCYFWASKKTSRFLRNGRYIFLLPLLLSQSVGAVALFAMAVSYELIKDKKYIVLFCSMVALLVLGFLVRERILESFGTFLERLLQMYDGMRCILEHPFTGIGAGWWGIAKQHYQSGFYEAKTLHSSFVAMGVNSGLVGLFLFIVPCLLEFKKLVVRKDYMIPAIIILLHSLVDFSLSFYVIPIAFLLSLPETGEEKTYPVMSFLRKGLSGAMLAGFLFLLTGNLISTGFQKRLAQGLSAAEATESFNESFYLRLSVKASQGACALLYLESDVGTNLMVKEYRYLPVEMVLLNSKGKGVKEEKEEYLLSCLQEQPYHTALKKIIIADCSAECAKRAHQITQEASRKASFLGKKLYQLKGENT